MSDDLFAHIHRTLTEHRMQGFNRPYISITSERRRELCRRFGLDEEIGLGPAETLFAIPLRVDDTLPADPGYAVTSNYPTP